MKAMRTSPCSLAVVRPLLFALPLLALSGMFGASSAPDAGATVVASPLEALAKEDVKKARKLGRWVGAALGAATAVVVAHNNGANDQQKALAGAGGGGVGWLIGDQVGAKVGNTIAARRLHYGKEHAFLEAEIQTADKAVSTRERQLIETERQAEARQAEIARLEASTKQTRKEIKAAEEELEAVNAKVIENNKLLEEYRSALDYLDQTLTSSAPESDATEAERVKWEQKKAALTAKRSELAAQYTRLQGVGEALDKDKNRLTALTSAKRGGS